MSAQTIARALARLEGATSGTEGARLSPGQLGQVRRYLEALVIWRERVALIATADPVRIVEHHILDSLVLAPRLSAAASLADIGSGAGFPGIPLAIAWPGMRTYLVESRRKKANFLRQVRREAALDNVEVIERRAEQIEGLTVDVVTSRALGSVDLFLSLATPLLRPGGMAIAMRGPEGLAEAVAAPGYERAQVVRYELALNRSRVLLLYRRL